MVISNHIFTNYFGGADNLPSKNIYSFTISINLDAISTYDNFYPMSVRILLIQFIKTLKELYFKGNSSKVI